MTDDRAKHRAPRVPQAIVLLLPVTLAVMATAALAPGLPQLHERFASAPGGRWLVPMILTIPSLCMILVAPIAGIMGDRMARRTLLIVSLIVYALMGMAPLVLDNLIAILISRVGVGIAEAFAVTMSTTLIADHFAGSERDKWLGYQTGIASVAAIFLVAIGGFLGRYGWQGPFAIYALPFVFALLIHQFVWEPDRSRPASAPVSSAEFPWRTMVGICAITLFASVSFYVAQIQSGKVLAAAGLREPGQIGLLIGLASLGTLGGTIIFRFVSNWPVPRLIAIAFALIALGYAGVAMAGSPQLLTAWMGIAQFGCGILLPTLLTWAMRLLPPEMRGRGTGMWNGFFSLGQFLSPVTVTAAAVSLGGLLPAFWLFSVVNAGAAALAGAAIFLPALHRERMKSTRIVDVSQH